MQIRITVPHSTQNEVFARVSAIAQLLHDTDINFKAVEIAVVRGSVSAPIVDDPADKMREHLLELMITQAMDGDPNSVFGTL